MTRSGKPGKLERKEAGAKRARDKAKAEADLDRQAALVRGAVTRHVHRLRRAVAAARLPPQPAATDSHDPLAGHGIGIRPELVNYSSANYSTTGRWSMAREVKPVAAAPHSYTGEGAVLAHLRALPGGADGAAVEGLVELCALLHEQVAEVERFTRCFEACFDAPPPDAPTGCAAYAQALRVLAHEASAEAVAALGLFRTLQPAALEACAALGSLRAELLQRGSGGGGDGDARPAMKEPMPPLCRLRAQLAEGWCASMTELMSLNLRRSLAAESWAPVSAATAQRHAGSAVDLFTMLSELRQVHLLSMAALTMDLFSPCPFPFAAGVRRLCAGGTAAAAEDAPVFP